MTWQTCTRLFQAGMQIVMKKFQSKEEEELHVAAFVLEKAGIQVCQAILPLILTTTSRT